MEWLHQTPNIHFESAADLGKENLISGRVWKIFYPASEVLGHYLLCSAVWCDQASQWLWRFHYLAPPVSVSGSLTCSQQWKHLDNITKTPWHTSLDISEVCLSTSRMERSEGLVQRRRQPKVEPESEQVEDERDEEEDRVREHHHQSQANC